MKIEQISEFMTIIYLKDKIVDFEEKHLIEDYFISLFQTLKEKYNLNVKGYYNIKIYVDKFYGSVFLLEKEDIETYDFSDTVDMRVELPIKKEFMFKINDLNFIENMDKFILYKDKFNLYLKIKKDLTKKEISYLLEHSEIIYKKINNLKMVNI
ncbi:MAG: hypothetical protein R3Y21_04420 [Mycoplasmatota bacterium]